MKIYNDELKNNNTNYFVIDSGSNVNHDDVDFKIYSWRKDLNKKIQEGDLFIYRRSGGGSEYRNQFYLFGAGKIGKSQDSISKRAIIKIEKPFVFNRKLFKSDLETFPWHFKKHSGLWSNFFNMNGITQITKDDFIYLLEYQNQLSPSVTTLTDNEEKLASYIYQSEQMGEFFVADKMGEMDTYIPAQKIFSDLILANYDYKCAITKDTKNLKPSRIVPWQDNKNIRMDFKNGICLVDWLAQAFEDGMCSFSDAGKLIISKKASSTLFEQLSEYRYKKIPMHKRYSPKVEYLKFHRENIFQ